MTDDRATDDEVDAPCRVVEGSSGSPSPEPLLPTPTPPDLGKTGLRWSL